MKDLTVKVLPISSCFFDTDAMVSYRRWNGRMEQESRQAKLRPDGLNPLSVR